MRKKIANFMQKAVTVNGGADVPEYTVKRTYTLQTVV